MGKAPIFIVLGEGAKSALPSAKLHASLTLQVDSVVPAGMISVLESSVDGPAPYVVVLDIRNEGLFPELSKLVAGLKGRSVWVLLAEPTETQAANVLRRRKLATTLGCPVIGIGGDLTLLRAANALAEVAMHRLESQGGEEAASGLMVDATVYASPMPCAEVYLLAQVPSGQEEDAAETLTDMRALFLSRAMPVVLRRVLSKDTEGEFEMTALYLEEEPERLDEELRALSGITAFDELAGGLPCDLVAVSAPLGNLKTSLALAMALQREGFTLFLTGSKEQPPQAMWRVDRDLSDARPANAELFRLASVTDEMAAKIGAVSLPGLSLKQLARNYTNWIGTCCEHMSPPDLIVVDAINQFSVDGDEDVEAALASLRDLATRFRVPVLVLQYLHPPWNSAYRPTSRTKSRLRLAASMVIEMRSDKDKGQAEVRILKNVGGGCGTLTLPTFPVHEGPRCQHSFDEILERDEDHVVAGCSACERTFAFPSDWVHLVPSSAEQSLCGLPTEVLDPRQGTRDTLAFNCGFCWHALRTGTVPVSSRWNWDAGERFSEKDVQARAKDDAEFKRAQRILVDQKIRKLETEPHRARAVVRGSESFYEVKVHMDLSGTCDCKSYTRGGRGFCKHMAAVALAWLGDRAGLPIA